MLPTSLPIAAVPEETARVAHAAFPAGNTLLQLRDVLGTIYTDEQFANGSLGSTWRKPISCSKIGRIEWVCPFRQAEPACFGTFLT